MFTVLANNRNSSLYLVIALAAILIVAMTVAPSLAAPGPAVTTLADAQIAHDLFREGERSVYQPAAPSSIGSQAFYEYRRGEWWNGPVDAIGEFRQEELSLYNRSETSSVGGAAFYEYRRGEWFGE